MIRNGKKKAISCALVAAMSVGLAACGTTSYDFKVSYDGIKTGDVSSKVSVHDPSILKADGEYYIFGSHMSAAKSSDLLNWERLLMDIQRKILYTDRYMMWQMKPLRILEARTH